jgi:putative endonuclease
MSLWGIYLLECADGTLYCGITNDLDSRLAAHNCGKGAKYTRGRLPVSLLAFSGCRFEHGEALRLERRIKRLPKHRKAAQIRALADGAAAGND